MDITRRIVTQLPPAELWSAAGVLPVARRRDVTTADLRAVLRGGAVRFAVADVGLPLRWIPVEDCFQFWTVEVRPRVIDGHTALLDDFPGGRCYVASEWGSLDGMPVVVLSLYH